MYTLRQYLLSLTDPHGLTRTLGEIEVCRDTAGQLLYTAGNSAAIFRIRHRGRLRSLRCYARPMHHLRAIYGEGYLPRELYLYMTPDRGVWVDVVVGDWIDGTTLQEQIARAAKSHDCESLKTLARAFDTLAEEMLSDDRAHGDLKPENILVDQTGRLHLIDFDATFLPQFAGELSPELGTAAFQHPMRTVADFDASLDDYPAALISTALHALVLDPTLFERHGAADGLLFAPQRIASDPALREVLQLFESTGAAVEYRIARLLLSPMLRLPELAKLLAIDPESVEQPTETPRLFVENGLWGYRVGENAGAKTWIMPLYDCGFDFSEGLAAVQLGRTWHYIDPTGRTVLSLPDCEAVKPFRNGRATIIRRGLRLEIDPFGREFAI